MLCKKKSPFLSCIGGKYFFGGELGLYHGRFTRQVSGTRPLMHPGRESIGPEAIIRGIKKREEEKFKKEKEKRNRLQNLSVGEGRMESRLLTISLWRLSLLISLPLPRALQIQSRNH